jgi:hypothetical protein
MGVLPTFLHNLAALPKSNGGSSPPQSSVSFLEIMGSQCRLSGTQAYYRYWSEVGAVVSEIIATLQTVRRLMPMLVPISTCPAVRKVNACQGVSHDNICHG